jgi:hypothetical protein
MPETERSTFTVTPTGVGRKDYSQDVQVQVEPIIRDYQSKYNSGLIELTVDANNSNQQEIEFETGYVYVLYDFFCSIPRNSLIRLKVDIYSAAGNWITIIDQYGYQNVITQLLKGFPMATKYRVTVYNYCPDEVDARFSAHGIRTEETRYYGRQVTAFEETL